MTDRESQIRERCDKATKGDWRFCKHASSSKFSGIITDADTGRATPYVAAVQEPGGEQAYIGIKQEDAEFLEHARTDIPYLLDRVAELETQLKEALLGQRIRQAQFSQMGELCDEAISQRDAIDKQHETDVAALLKGMASLTVRAEAAESKLAAAEELARAADELAEDMEGEGYPNQTVRIRAALAKFREAK